MSITKLIKKRSLVAGIAVLAVFGLSGCQWLSDFRDRQQPKIDEPSPALVKKELGDEPNVKVANYPIKEKL